MNSRCNRFSSPNKNTRTNANRAPRRGAFLLLFALIALGAAADLPARKNLRVWRFYLQPYKNTRVFIDGRPVRPRLIRRDKTQALVSVRHRFAEDSFQVRFTRPGYATLEKTVRLSTERKRFRSLRLYNLYQLTKKGEHDLGAYWPVGSWPKSATFLDRDRVVLPLLAGKGKNAGIDVLNIRNGTRVHLRPPRRYARRSGFVETLVLPEKREFWVSQMSQSSVHIFDSLTLAYKSTIRLKGRWTKVLLHDPARKLVYASNWSSHDISVIDVNRKKELYRLRAGGIPRGMILSPSGKHMYVALFAGYSRGPDGRDRVRKNNIVKIDLKKRKIIKRFGRRGAKRHIVKDGRGRMYVSDMWYAKIEVYDLKTDRLIKRIPVFYKPNTIVLSPDEKRLYVSCRGPNHPRGYTRKGLRMGRLYAIDLDRLEVSEFWEGGNQPTGLDISPDGKSLVSTDFLDNRVRVYTRR